MTGTDVTVKDLALQQAHSAKDHRLKVLAFVHLRNIVGSTGAGRVARCLVEQLYTMPDLDLRILADRGDYQRIASQAGKPWTDLRTYFFSHDTSVQQAGWLLADRPAADSFWPEIQVAYCTAESYVPVKNSKLVVTLHDAAHLERDALPRNVATFKQRVKWNILYRVLDRKADAFHTVSEFSAERLGHFWPSIKSRLHVIPNGIAECFLGPRPTNASVILNEMGLTNERFVLLPCGLHYRKNAELILNSWPIIRSVHKDLKLITTNSSDSIYAKQAQALGGSVISVGHVSDSALNVLYRKCEVVWFPSLYEGFGMPVLEAMACGAAVLTSKASAVPEIAGNAAVLADPRSVNDQVDALLWLLEDAKSAEKYRSLGPIRAKGFTWRKSAERMRDLFRTLADLQPHTNCVCSNQA